MLEQGVGLLAAVPAARRMTAREASSDRRRRRGLRGRGTQRAKGTMTDSYTLLRESVGAVWVPRDVIWVSGAEATEYLQGQLSQDLAPLDTGQSAWTFALQPQGRVIRGSGSPAWTTGSSSMWTTASAQRSLPGSNGSSSARTCSSSRSAGSSSPSEARNRRSGAPRVADRPDPGWPGVEGSTYWDPDWRSLTRSHSVRWRPTSGCGWRPVSRRWAMS